MKKKKTVRKAKNTKYISVNMFFRLNRPKLISAELLPSQLGPCCAIAGDYSSPGQKRVFVLVELREVPVCPFLQPICFPLEGTSALEHVKWFNQRDGVCKSDVGVFRLLYRGVGKDVKILFRLTVI